MIISADNISHRFNNRVVLDQVSLEVKKGDFITIIGPNGAGKSTLLKCLMGLITPDHGQIKRKPHSRIGYIPQRMAVNPSLPITVARFIELNKSKASTPNRTSLTVDLGINDLAHKPIHSLSGGEWQRVLLARALQDEPEAIILDEPAQNLDISGQLQFYKTLDEIHQNRGIAILMVSHDLHMVMASTQQVVCLYHHICCSGAPQTVARDPEFAHLFGQDMAKMMAIYQHQHDHDHHHGHHGHHHDHHHDHHHGHEHQGETPHG